MADSSQHNNDTVNTGKTNSQGNPGGAPNEFSTFSASQDVQSAGTPVANTPPASQLPQSPVSASAPPPPSGGDDSGEKANTGFSGFAFLRNLDLKKVKPQVYAIALTLVVTIVALAYFINSYLTGTRAGTNDVTIEMTAPSTAAVGEEINVGVQLSNSNYYITGADICLGYDSSVLEYVPGSVNQIGQTPDHFNEKVMESTTDEQCAGGVRKVVVAKKADGEFSAKSVIVYFTFNILSNNATTLTVNTAESQFSGTLTENNGIFGIDSNTQTPQATVNGGGEIQPTTEPVVTQSPIVLPPLCKVTGGTGGGTVPMSSTPVPPGTGGNDAEAGTYTYYYPLYTKNHPLGDNLRTQWSFPVLNNITTNTANVTLRIRSAQDGSDLRSPITKTIPPKSHLNFFGHLDEWFSAVNNNEHDGKTARGWYEITSDRPLAGYNRTAFYRTDFTTPGMNSISDLPDDVELSFFEDEALYTQSYQNYHIPIYTKHTSGNPGRQYTDLVITNVSGTDANITITARRGNGTELGRANITVGKDTLWSSWNRTEWMNLVPDDERGGYSLEINASSPVMVLHRQRTNNDVNHYPEGHHYKNGNAYFNEVLQIDDENPVPESLASQQLRSTLYLMKHTTHVPNRWQWTFPVVKNTTDTTANIDINIYKSSGGLYHTVSKQIPPNGLYNSWGDEAWRPLDESNPNGTPKMTDVGPSWGFGYMEIQSDQPVIANNRLLFVESSDNPKFSDPIIMQDDEPFIQATRVTKKLYVMHYLRNWPAYQNNVQYSNTVIANPNNTAAQMKVQLRRIDDGRIIKELNKTIPSTGHFNGHVDPDWYNAPNTVYNTDYNATNAWIEIDTDKPVFGMNRVRIQNTPNDPFAPILTHDDDEDMVFQAEDIGACSDDSQCGPGQVCEDGECKDPNGPDPSIVPPPVGSCEDYPNTQCVDGYCICQPGWNNCDRDWSNGCEVNGICGGQDDDTDDDGIPDSEDLDDDNDGIPDTEEGDGNRDTDGDGLPDSKDIDSDGDGITDTIEANPSPAHPFTQHVPNQCADADGDGLLDMYGTGIVPVDTDGDGTPDYIDSDSDGDGVPDRIEGDDAMQPLGKADHFPFNSDADADGLDDGYDILYTLDGTCVVWLQNLISTIVPLQDTDSDGTEDWRDPDDDGDGTPTRNEDTNNDGDWSNDDADNDGIPSYLDPDEGGTDNPGACPPGTYNCNGQCIPYGQPCDQCTIGATCGTNKVFDSNCNCVCGPGYVDCNNDGECELPTDPVCEGNVSTIKSIKVKFQGVIPVGGRRPSEDPLNSEVSIVGPNYTETTRADFYAYATEKDDAGNDVWLWEAKDVPFRQLNATDTYKVYIKGPKHLQKKVCDNNPTEARDGGYVCSDGNITIDATTEELDFTGIYLLAGDLPYGGGNAYDTESDGMTAAGQDRIVDSVDITFLRAALKRSQEERKELQLNKIGDLSLDAIVDAQDYQLAIYSLGFKYDDQLLDDTDDSQEFGTGN